MEDPCTGDGDSATEEIYCPVKKVCEVPVTPGACGENLGISTSFWCLILHANSTTNNFVQYNGGITWSACEGEVRDVTALAPGNVLQDFAYESVDRKQRVW